MIELIIIIFGIFGLPAIALIISDDINNIL